MMIDDGVIPIPPITYTEVIGGLGNTRTFI